MKNLNEYIQESLLDDEDELVEKSDIFLVEEFIKNNYSGQYKIHKRLVKGKYQVSSTKGDIWVSNPNITRLTNDLFEWTSVKGFKIFNCASLESLEGAPKKVKEDFKCPNCVSLKTLKGAPEKVGREFNCHGCTSLESLEGAPKDCNYFACTNCTSLKTLEGAPVKCVAFYCNYCSSLKTLEGAPKECKHFFCRHCGGEFTEDNVKAVCDVIDVHVNFT